MSICFTRWADNSFKFRAALVALEFNHWIAPLGLPNNEIKRAEYRKSLQQNSLPVDSYAASVKVDFVAVLDRHFHKMGDAA